MPNYAVIENGTVTNTVEATPDFAAQQGWTDLPLGYQIGDEFDGANWKSNKVVLTVEQLKAQSVERKVTGLRTQRDALLAETDWTQAADVPQLIKDKYAPYRQGLRDVPQQPGFPDNIQWPVKP